MPGFRKHGRILTKCSVRLSHNDLGDIVAETRDISETGVFVACKELLHTICVGDTVEAELHSERQDVSHAHLRVIRLTEEGVGLAFE